MGRKLGSIKEPPYLGLRQSLEISHEIYTRMGGSASRDDLAELLGNTPVSSSFTKKISALRVYGLLEESGNNHYKLTELAYRAVSPNSKLEEARARLEIFRKVIIFSKIHDIYKGKICPEISYLANTIERESGVTKDAKLRWAEAFLEAIEAVGLQSIQGGKTVIRSDVSVAESAIDEGRPQENGVESEYRPTPPSTPLEEKSEPGTIRLVFPFSGKGEAKIYLPGNLNQNEVKKLITLLEISLGDMPNN